MNVRNPKHTATAAIDMEIDHPTYGWIPFTASPDDPEQHGRDLHARALAGEFGTIAAYVAPIVTQAEQFKAIERAIEQHMDRVAQADGWDNRWTCVARAGYANPWQAKGIKFGQWMDNCWTAVIQAQADVVAGTRTMPTPEQAVAELPVMVW